jgi:CheY-like chemotaxis protein
MERDDRPLLVAQRISAALTRGDNRRRISFMIGPAVASEQLRYLLVVDSDWSDRFTLSMLLQRFGYSVASTNNAREGIEYLCVAPVEAVFAEAGPVSSELIERLKKDPRFSDIPIIIVATERNREMEERLRYGDIAGLLRTPVDPAEVFTTIQKVIEKGSRSNIRIATAIEAVLHHDADVRNGFITVLSQLGMFFRTLEPLPVETRVTAAFPIWDKAVRLEAQVLYPVTFEQGPFCEPGMGMKFIHIGPQDSAMIKAFIHEQLGMVDRGWA